MKPKLALILVLLALLVVLIVQNTHRVILKVYFWEISLPMVIFTLVVLVLGLLIGYFFAKYTGREKKVQTPEKM